MTGTELTAVSLFAGIGGIDRALELAGIRVVAAVEIDKECRGVLARKFPGVLLFEDVREVTGDQLIAAGFVPGRGVLAGGWPCTGNSVAGRREGLGDPRSGLWRHVVRLLAETRPAWFLGENVPGLLSVNGGADIAIVRNDLAQLGYWWAERILDAQHFGVAQRRARLFFVGCLGDRAAPVEVLLEPEGGEGNPAAGEAAGTDVAGTLGSRVGGSRSTDLDGHGAYVASTLQSGSSGRGYRIDAESAAGGHLIPLDLAQLTSAENRSNPQPGDPMATLAAAGRPAVAYAIQDGRGMDKAQNGVGVSSPGEPSYSLDTTGAQSVAYATPLALRGRDGGSMAEAGQPGDPMFTLRTPGGGSSHPMVSYALTSRNDRNDRNDREDNYVLEDSHRVPRMSPPLTSEGHDASEDGTGRQALIPMAFSPNTGGDVRLGYAREAPALNTSQPAGVQSGAAVRRLTPRERERLQGFPETTKALRIEVWQCSEHPKNHAHAVARNPRSQKSACAAGALGSSDPVRPAGSHSECSHPDPALPVAVSVHIDCEAKTAEIRSPDGRYWFVNGAVPNDPSPLAALFDLSARVHALTPHEREQAISTGRAASPPSPVPSTHQPSGAICVPVCGLEISAAASGAHKSGHAGTSHSTSTTSQAGRTTQPSGLTWATLCCSALSAIGSLILLPTPETTSYAVELTATAGWTRWRLEDGREVEQSDAARDRQTGNSVAVPCVEWITRRIVAADAALDGAA